MGFYPYTYAVFGAMADKDIAGVLAHVHVHKAALPGLAGDHMVETDHIAAIDRVHKPGQHLLDVLLDFRFHGFVHQAL